MLGYDPCYHMRTAMTHYSHMKFWVKARAGNPVDYTEFFRSYRAVVDWPACEFFKQLMASFPEAKVVLNVRDPDEWYDSVIDTLWVITRVLPCWFPKVMRQMHEDVIWKGRFQGEFADRAKALAVYNAHLEDVRRRVSPERLLVFNVNEGWKPLCEFLGKPVPENVPFPHLNDRLFFRRVILGLRILEWLVPAVVLVGLVWLGLMIC